MPVNFSEYGPTGFNYLAMAEEVVRSTYGDVVSIDRKAKFLRKWGQRASTDGSNDTEIWTGPDAQESHVAGNQIDSITSSALADAGLEYVVEGHTRSALTGDLTFVSQTATLNGTDARTRTALTTPLHRVNRLYNNDSTDCVGTVQVFEDTALTGGVPDDTSKIHLQNRAGKNQSEKGATSLSSQDYWFITEIGGSVASKTGNPIVDIDLETRAAGKVWRKQFEFTVASQGSSTFSVPFDPPIIVPPNADVRLLAEASTTAEVNGYINGVLAVVVG